MKWTRYHPIAVQWKNHPLIGRTLRLEKQAHRYWLMLEPSILNELLNYSPAQVWKFIDSVGTEILKDALRLNKQKIKNRNLRYGSVFDSHLNPSIAAIKSLWILGMRLSLASKPAHLRMHAVIDTWLRQLKLGKSIDIETTLNMAIPWMNDYQRKQLAMLSLTELPGTTAEQQALQKAWVYGMGCEPDDWTPSDYDIAARTMPRILNVGFYYAGPVQCPWIRNIEPLYRHWILSRTRQLKGDLTSLLLQDMLQCAQSIRLDETSMDCWWYWHCIVTEPPHLSVHSVMKGLRLRGITSLRGFFIGTQDMRSGPAVDMRVVECIAQNNVVLKECYAKWEPLAKCTLQADTDERVLVERMWAMYHQAKDVIVPQEAVFAVEGLIS